MNEKDLFNAINDIDPKYIANAWKNTDFSTEPTVIHIENDKPSKLRIFGVAAAFAAAAAAVFLAVYVRVNYPKNNDLTPPTGSNSSTSSASYDQSGNFLAGPGELPFKMRGLDDVQIKYSDVAGVLTGDGDLVKADEFDPENWAEVSIVNFTYLAKTAFTSLIAIESHTDQLEPDEYKWTDVSYRRYGKGDKFGTLTVKDTFTRFKYVPEYNAAVLDICYAEFDGAADVNAFVFRKEGESMLYCVLMNMESSLPIVGLSPHSLSNMYDHPRFTGESASGELKYNTEYPAILLKNTEIHDAEELFNGKDYAAVTLTLSDISMASDRAEQTFILADASDIQPYVSEGELPFELLGADGVRIRYEDIDRFITKDGECVYYANKITADNWKEIYCEDFGYIAQPTGGNYNTLDDPEMFTGNTELTEQGKANTPTEFRRINVGDKFGDLTVKSASVKFCSKGPSVMSDHEAVTALHMAGSEIVFNGNAIMDGYIVDMEDSKTVYFVPANGETALPVMFPATDKNGKTISYRNNGVCPEGGFSYSTELPRIILQKYDMFNWDYYVKPGECKRVNINLTNIRMVYDRDSEYGANIEATIARINGNKFGLIGADGKQINIEDVAFAQDKTGNQISPVDLTADNWEFITCNFAYLAEPNEKRFSRYKVGDTICGLTVTSAEATFRNNDEAQSDELKYVNSNVKFEGVFEMDTYIVKYGKALYCADMGLPIAGIDKEELYQNGRFIPETPQPHFDPVHGFVIDDPDDTPQIMIKPSMVENMSERLDAGEIIPVHVSLSDISVDCFGISANVFRISER